MSLSKKIKGALLKSLTKKRPIDFDIKKSQKVLFLRYDRLGDMIITTPVFRELKKAYPNIEISVLASKVNQAILENNPYVDKVYTNHKNEFFNDYSTLKELQNEQFDVAVEFDHSVIPHAILRLKVINPKKIISVYKDGRYGVKGTELEMYDFFTKSDLNRHFRDIWLETLSYFDIKTENNSYDIFVTEEQEQQARDFLSQFEDKKTVGINLEGAVKGKKVESKEFQEICEGLYKENNNIQIIVLYTPNKREEVEALITSMNLDYVVPSFITNSILDLAALVKYLDLVITPDTSIVHVASAFNVPLVSIHEKNMSSYTFFAPVSDKNHTVFAQSENGLVDYCVNEIVETSITFLKFK